MAGGLDSLLCNVLGLGQFPSPLRCGRLPDMRGLGVQQRVVALKPGCLVARRRLPVVSRCKLAIGRGSALNWWDSIYVGYAVSTVGAFAFHVPCGSAAGPSCRAASHRLRPPRFSSPVLGRWDNTRGVTPLGSESQPELRVCRPCLSPSFRAGAYPLGANFRRAGWNDLLADPPVSHLDSAHESPRIVNAVAGTQRQFTKSSPPVH